MNLGGGNAPVQTRATPGRQMLRDRINTRKLERLHSEAERRRMVARAWGGRKKEEDVSNDVTSQLGSRNSRSCHVTQWLELRTI